MSKVAILGARHVARSAPFQEPPAIKAKPGLLKDLMTVTFLFVALRGALFGFNYVGRTMTQPTIIPPPRPSNLSLYWDGWIRWDAGWFMTVVKNGYFFKAKELQAARSINERNIYEMQAALQAAASNVVFFPLYPYAIRAAIKLVGGRNHWVAGLAISNISTVFGLFFMLRIARRYLDEEGARRSLVYLLLFPSSFFFSSYYSEGLFLLTTTASFYYFLERKYFLCGVWGFLAALTRNPGVLLFPSFVLGYLWNNQGKITREDVRAIWLLLIPCGLLTFMVVLYLRVGDPLAFVHAQAAWYRKPSFPLQTLWEAFRAAFWSVPHHADQWIHIMNLVSSVSFLILPFFLLGRFNKSLAIFSLLVILMPLSTSLVVSMMRYALSAFPVFFVLAKFGENRNVDRIIVSLSSLFLGLLNLGFANVYSIF